MKKLFLSFLAVVMVLTAGLVSTDTISTTASTDTTVKGLLNEYYNDGEYRKDSQIYYVGEAGGKYDSSFFHAGVDNLIRETKYSAGKLYMSNSEGTINSGYKDVDGGMAHYYKNGKSEVVDYVVEDTTVEDFYTTLYDLKDVNSWTKSGTKYSLSLNENTCTPWVHFIAPLWISKHISITKVVVYEENGLVLQLYGKASAGAETDSLFAQATVHYTKTITQEFNGSESDVTDGFFSWNGKLYPSKTNTIVDADYTGCLFIKTTDDETQAITFNGTNGATLKITCIGLLGNQAKLIINGQEFYVDENGATVVTTIYQSGLVSITTDTKMYVYKIEYIIEK